MMVNRNYQVIRYNLQLRRSTNGDGGLSYPPGIVPNDAIQNSFVNCPLKLDGPSELGWSGDQIVDFDCAAWMVVGVVGGTNPPVTAIVLTEGR